MTKTILVADDSKTIQQVVSLTFRATDFKVVTASDGDEALRRIADARPDLVLADVAMPGKNGYELCGQIKNGAGTSHIPVLLLAGSFEPIDDRRAQDARADGHIKKPFDSQSLIDRVKSLTGATVGAEMPMSFAASLAARQRPPEPPPAPPAPAYTPPKAAPEPKHFASDLGVPSRPAWGQDGRDGASPFGPPRQEARGAATVTLDPAPDRAPPPRIQAPPPVQARAVVREEVMIEEPEVIDDAEIVEDDEDMSIETASPSLEPPALPADRPRANVDMWALADAPDRGSIARARQEQVTREMSADAVPGLYAQARAEEDAEGDAQAIEEIEVDEIPVETHRRAVQDGVARIAQSAAEPIAAAAQAAVPGLPQDQLMKIAREVIERIAWEVVPDLAETIIKAELDRLLRDRA
jgi:CheY-like chemotaxis protein